MGACNDCLTCAVSSDLEQMCDSTIVLYTADEKSMVMTRSFRACFSLWQILAARWRETAVRPRAQRMAESFALRIHSIAKRPKLSSNSTPSGLRFSRTRPVHECEGSFAQVMEMSCSYSQFFHTLVISPRPEAIVSPERASCFS